MEQVIPTSRTKIIRGPKRAEYDREVIYNILDEAFVCHIGGTVKGFPCVQPNLHWRIGDQLYIHGSSKNALIASILEQGKTCITVSLFDGLVLARSAFHHSINYRSVMLYGKPELVTDAGEKKQVLDALLEKCKAGRSQEARPPNASELKATSVIRIPIQEVSAKVRTGAPVDDPKDMQLDVWAGVIPAQLVFADPIIDLG